ncbi:hypothetical protein ACFQNE_02955 [Gordonia phosphorivorans]|uniref:Replication protein n=1 Tax=Gordonia phosphorivorans TaxID=1056982 RepID=A0ABV6H417_9ACTN
MDTFGPLPVLTPEEQAKRDGHVRWRQQADQRNREKMLRRQRELRRRAAQIAYAIDAYKDIDSTSGDPILIRTDFVRLPTARPHVPFTAITDELETRPPMTRLIAAAGGNALPTYLTMLYVAQQEGTPGSSYTYDRNNTTGEIGQPAWARLAGLQQPRSRPNSGRNPAPAAATIDPALRFRQSRRAFNTALKQLHTHGLITPREGATGTAGTYTGFRVLADDGTGLEYIVPGQGASNVKALRIPEAFFRQGWHLVLTPSEIAVLLAIIDRTGHLRLARRDGTVADTGVDLKESVRRDFYGLSGEAYEAVHVLDALGLITCLDPMPDRSKVSPDQRLPFRLFYPASTQQALGAPFERDAFAAVSALLGAR